MQTSDITPTSARPLSDIADVNYRSLDKATAEAKGRTTGVAITGPLRIDRSSYEFPGDRTYENYLSSKGAI